MNTIEIPHPDEIRRRIESCEAELRALRRLLRTAQDAFDAEQARAQRDPRPATPEEAAHA